MDDAEAIDTASLVGADPCDIVVWAQIMYTNEAKQSTEVLHNN